MAWWLRALVPALLLAAELGFLTDRTSCSSLSIRRPKGHTVPGLDRRTEGSWTQPFFFVQLADPQFGMFEENKSWEKEVALLERAVEAINRLRPRFVMVTGDMTNQSPDGDVYRRQAAAYLRVLRGIDASIPVLHVPGNHDLGNRPTAKALEAYRRRFGDDWYSFWVGGVCCIALDSALYYDPSALPRQQARQEAWLRRELRAARDAGARQILVFQHHPWFLRDAQDADAYEVIPRERRLPALDLLREAGVTAVFAGHYHQNADARYGPLEIVVNGPVGRPLGKDPSGLRIVEVYGDRVVHRYFGLDNVPHLPPPLR